MTNHQSHHEIERLYKQATVFISIGGTLIGLIFTYFLWKYVSLGDWVDNAKQQDVQTVVLWLYYLAWIVGSPFDAYYQKWVYIAAPAKVEIRMQSIVLVAFLLLAAVTFLFVRDNDEIFSVALGVFLVINAVGWHHILQIIRPITNASRVMYRQNEDYVGLEQLEIFNHHMMGHWQVWRFSGMFLIVSTLIIVSFVQSVLASLSADISSLLPTVSEEAVSRLMPDALFIVFVVFAEGVIWFMRMKMKISIDAIDILENQYRFVPRSLAP